MLNRIFTFAILKYMGKNTGEPNEKYLNFTQVNLSKLCRNKNFIAQISKNYMLPHICLNNVLCLYSDSCNYFSLLYSNL